MNIFFPIFALSLNSITNPSIMIRCYFFFVFPFSLFFFPHICFSRYFLISYFNQCNHHTRIPFRSLFMPKKYIYSVCQLWHRTKNIENVWCICHADEKQHEPNMIRRTLKSQSSKVQAIRIMFQLKRFR